MHTTSFNFALLFGGALQPTIDEWERETRTAGEGEAFSPAPLFPLSRR